MSQTIGKNQSQMNHLVFFLASFLIICLIIVPIFYWLINSEANSVADKQNLASFSDYMNFFAQLSNTLLTAFLTYFIFKATGKLDREKDLQRQLIERNRELALKSNSQIDTLRFFSILAESAVVALAQYSKGIAGESSRYVKSSEMELPIPKIVTLEHVDYLVDRLDPKEVYLPYIEQIKDDGIVQVLSNFSYMKEISENISHILKGNQSRYNSKTSDLEYIANNIIGLMGLLISDDTLVSEMQDDLKNARERYYAMARGQYKNGKVPIEDVRNILILPVGEVCRKYENYDPIRPLMDQCGRGYEVMNDIRVNNVQAMRDAEKEAKNLDFALEKTRPFLDRLKTHLQMTSNF